MKKKKQPENILVGVKLPVQLDRAIEVKCAREGMLKREFIMLACRKLLEATNGNA